VRRSAGWQPTASQITVRVLKRIAHAAVLQDREVGQGQADLVGEAGQGQTARRQEVIEVDLDPVLLFGVASDDLV
jgi:hypothetical protein